MSKRDNSKTQILYDVLPLLQEVRELSAVVMAAAGLQSGAIPAPAGNSTGSLTNCAANFSLKRSDGTSVTPRQAADSIARILGNVRLRELSSADLQDLKERVLAWKREPNRKQLRKIHDELAVLIPSIDDLISKLAIESFGPWGAHFFLIALQYEPAVSLILSPTNKRSAFPAKGEPAHSVLKDLRHFSLAKVDVSLENFSISVKGAEPCVLGNVQSYTLLSILWNSCNKYVAVQDIAEQMGKDELDTKTVKYAKCRLVKRLIQEGYAEVARSIKSHRNCYGLFLLE